MSKWMGSVAEPRPGGRVVDLHQIERDGETWMLLVAPDGCLRIPAEVADSLATLLRAYANGRRKPSQ